MSITRCALRGLVAALSAPLAAALAPAAHPSQGFCPPVLAIPGHLERISLDETDQQTSTCTSGPTPCKNNSHPTISGDGTLVAFDSDAWLVTSAAPNPTNVRQMYVRDLTLGRTVLVSRTSNGTYEAALPANATSSLGAISGDGRRVAFTSYATNLDPRDFNNQGDVFVHDLATGSTELVSLTGANTSGNGISTSPSLSHDGTKIAFRSQSTDLGPLLPVPCGMLPDKRHHIYVRDMVAGVVEWISYADGCVLPNGPSHQPSITGNARLVAFMSQAANLVAGDLNGSLDDIFVRDRATGTLEPVSVSITGQLDGNGWSVRPGLAAFGRYVAFESQASNLVRGDTNGVPDIFVRDLAMNRTTRVSVDSAGVEANGPSTYSALSGDGRFVAFSSAGTNLVWGDATSAFLDFFRHDRDADGNGIFDEPGGICTIRLSVSDRGRESNAVSGGNTDLSYDGSVIPFMSEGSNLIPGDTNGARDIFTRWIP